MVSKVQKSQIGSLAALYYIARRTVGALTQGRQLPDETVDTIVANKVLGQCEKLEDDGKGAK